MNCLEQLSKYSGRSCSAAWSLWRQVRLAQRTGRKEPFCWLSVWNEYSPRALFLVTFPPILSNRRGAARGAEDETSRPRFQGSRTVDVLYRTFAPACGLLSYIIGTPNDGEIGIAREP